MTANLLPEIPRIITAFAEWGACVVYIIPRRKRSANLPLAIILTLCAGAQYGLQMLVSRFNLTFWIAGMFLNVLFMFAYIFVCCDIRVNEAIYWCAVAFVTAEFLAAFYWQISCMMQRNGIEWGRWQHIAVCMVVFIGILLLVWFAEKKTADIEEKIGWNQAITTLIFTIIAFSMSNASFLNSQWNSTLIQQWSVYWIRVLVDFCVIIILYLQQQILVEQTYRNELASINNMLNLQYKQYLDFKESSEYISRQCHDLKHQIAELRTACTEEEREAYLTEIEGAIALYNGQNVTGNAVLDAILTRKNIYCLQHEIDLSVSADGRAMAFLAVRDICTIMGNILDNAIEHVSGFEAKEERQIQGEIYQKNSFLMIRMENYYHGNGELKDTIPKTTKADKQRHGYGLKSVNYTVEKYGGSMTIRPEDNWFVIRILIPIMEENKKNKAQSELLQTAATNYAEK